MLVRFYPADFRHEFGEDMVKAFLDYWKLAGAGGRFLFALRVGTDWIRTAPRLLAVSGLKRTKHLVAELLSPNGVPSEIKRSLRGIVQRPLVNVMIVVSLAVGLGANATMFKALSSVLWSSLPVADANEIVRIIRFHRDEQSSSGMSYPNWLDMSASTADVFEAVMFHRMETFSVSHRQSNIVTHGEVVSPNYFDGLGVSTEIGSAFSADFHDPVAVLSYEFWTRELSGDPNIIGESVVLNGTPVSVIGVADRSFQGTKLGLAMDVWIPIDTWIQVNPSWRGAMTERGSRWLSSIARLNEGISLQEAEATVRGVSDRLANDHDVNRDSFYLPLAERGAVLFPDNPSLLNLVSAVGIGAGLLVLLISTLNAANLMFARSLERASEVSLKLALGASRVRLFRDQTVEIGVMAALAAVAAMFLSTIASRFLISLTPPMSYRLSVDLAPDASTTIMVGILTAAIVVVMGAFATGVSVRSSNFAAASRSTRSVTTRSRVPNALVTAQIAVSVTSLMIGGAFFASLKEARAVDPGVDVRNATLVSLDTSLEQYSWEQTLQLLNNLVTELRDSPSIGAVAITSLVPLGDRSAASGIFAAETRFEENAPSTSSWISSVGGDGLEAMGINPIAGRLFTEVERTDPSASSAAVINTELADRLWPEDSYADVVARRVSFGATASTIEVVGVVPTTRYRSVTEPTQPAMFVPLPQRTHSFNTLIVKPTPGASDDAGTIVRDRLAALAPTLPVYSVIGGAAHIEGALWLFRSGATFAGGLGVIALLLSASGLFATMSFSVARRQRELGIRIAIGATRTAIMKRELGLCSILVLAGLTLGTIPALAVGKSLESMLFGVSPFEPQILLAVPFTILVVALATIVNPVYRATRTDPLAVIRED